MIDQLIITAVAIIGAVYYVISRITAAYRG